MHTAPDEVARIDEPLEKITGGARDPGGQSPYILGCVQLVRHGGSELKIERSAKEQIHAFLDA